MDIFGFSISRTNHSATRLPAEEIKDLDAGLLAQGLLNIFGVSVCVAFIVLGLAVIGALYRPGSTNLAVVPMFKEALEILRLVGALFSPLLAFVLGYYFNQSAKSVGALAGAAAGHTAGSEAGTAAGAAAGAVAGAEASTQTNSDVGRTTHGTDDATSMATIAGKVAGTEAGAESGGQAGMIAAQEVEKSLHPSPNLLNLAPPSVVAGAADTKLTVNGSGFVNDSTVCLDGVTLPTTFVSDKQLAANIVSANLSSAKTHIVTVVNPMQSGGASNEVNFEVTS